MAVSVTLHSAGDHIPTVFISYAKEDREHATRLASDLRQLGATTWLDHQNLQPGERWSDRIDEAIRTSDYVVALLSSRSVSKRGYVQRELKRALDVINEIPVGRTFVIPARLDDCKPPSGLLDFQWVDLFGNWDSGVKAIAISMRLSGNPREAINNSDRSTMRHLSFSLPPAIDAQLKELRKLTGDESEAETIRRALALYALATEQRSAGSDLLISNGPEQVKIIIAH
jgi:hypothetical protein